MDQRRLNRESQYNIYTVEALYTNLTHVRIILV